MTGRIRESIRLRFMLVFIGTLILASLVTFPAILVGEAQRIMTAIEDQLTLDAGKVSLLSQRTDLSAQEIAVIAESSDIEVYVYDSLEAIKGASGLDDLTLKDGEGYMQPWGITNGLPKMAVRSGDDYYLLLPSGSDNLFSNLKRASQRALLACTLIGSLLMLIAVRTITDPVRRLNAATKRVAQGDFDVVLPEQTLDEIGQLTRNFNLMTRQLKQMETLRSDFISSISHEFKTPLASIQGFAKLLQKKDIPPQDADEYTQVIVEETDRLSGLCSNILRLNALENQTLPNKAVEFELDEQIRRCVLLLENQWADKQIEFDLDLAALHYVGDQDLLQQVWLNLIGNAVKFSNPGGKITLKLTQNKKNAVFSCEDQGAGINPEDQQRIFEKFYQADQSRAREGNGLGLAIVAQIVKLSDGKIEFSSEPGHGSIFTVTLPVGK